MGGILSSPKNMFHDHDQQAPSDQQVCQFMSSKGVKMEDNRIPIWRFNPDYNSRTSSLYLERYIDCSAMPTHDEQLVEFVSNNLLYVLKRDCWGARSGSFWIRFASLQP